MSFIHSIHPLVSVYQVIHIDTIQVKPSSLQTRLELIDLGVKTINNRVDVANLFMYQYAQPIHCFDASKIQGSLRVRMAQTDEQFVDLTGKIQTLCDQDLVIADDIKICALAGIIGSQDTAVTNQTQYIYIEIANFDPVTIRKTGVRYGLRTDAELRFEKKINPTWTQDCITHLLTHLNQYVSDLGTYTIAGQEQKINPYPQHQIINFAVSDMIQFIWGDGHVPADFVKQAEQIIRNIGCDLHIQENQRSVTAPHHRSTSDISIPEDIWEEVARLYGYDRINGLGLQDKHRHQPLIPEVSLQQHILTYLVDICHYDQVETYPRISDTAIEKFHIQKNNLHQLINPVAPEKSYLRPTLLSGLYDTVVKNFRHYDHIALCEIGKVRQTKKEYTALGIILYHKNASKWQEDTFLVLKGVLSELMAYCKLENLILQSTTLGYGHPHKQANLMYQNQIIGSLIQVHPLIGIQDKIPQSSQISYAEIIIDHLRAQTNSLLNQTFIFQTLENKTITKELCFVMPYDQKTNLLNMDHIDTIKGYQVYDIYDLGDGTKSVTLSYQITKNSVDETITNIIEEARQHGFSLKM